MALLRVLGTRGDVKVEWDIDKEETIREAERIFEENAAKGFASFKVDDGVDTAQRIESFDPQAKQILQLPRIMGG